MGRQRRGSRAAARKKERGIQWIEAISSGVRVSWGVAGMSWRKTG